MNVSDTKPKNPFGYEILRPLSFSSCIYLSREHASERLVVLKFFASDRKVSFEKEAKILAELQDFDGVPALYFAHEIKNEEPLRYCIGLEYIAGKSLLELTQEKNVVLESAKLKERLVQGLARMHDRYGIIHGDLSPRNILIRSTDQRVVFIDLEFAEKLSAESLASYESYRGTQGFKSMDSSANLIEKDRDALQACLKYCGVLDPAAAEKKSNPGFLQRWFKG